MNAVARHLKRIVVKCRDGLKANGIKSVVCNTALVPYCIAIVVAYNTFHSSSE